MTDTETYVVSFKETLLVKETVLAESKAEAIRLVRDGQGIRVSEEVDDWRGPYSMKASKQ